MTTKTNKQRSIRFGGDLEQWLEEQAAREGRSFSGQVNWIIRQARSQKAFTSIPVQRDNATAA